jgi:hypothetical protein
MRPTLKTVLLGVLAVTSAGPSSAADDARACVEVADDAQRLACYDAAFGRDPAPAPATGEAGPAGGVATAGRTTKASADRAPSRGAANTITVDPVAEFGLSESQKRAKDPERAKVASPDSISAKVAESRQLPTGELVVTLDNGQVWVQAEVLTKARATPGDAVTIRRAALGSFTLVTANKVAVKVRRVR